MAGERHRKAPRRTEILAELRAAGDHPTASELHRRLRLRLPSLSLGTVYRNLEALAAEGLVGKLAAPGCATCYDRTTDVHDHARCRRCGAVADIERSGPAPAPELPPGFALETWNLEYTGVCARCRGLAAVAPGAAAGA